MLSKLFTQIFSISLSLLFLFVCDGMKSRKRERESKSEWDAPIENCLHNDKWLWDVNYSQSCRNFYVHCPSHHLSRPENSTCICLAFADGY